MLSNSKVNLNSFRHRSESTILEYALLYHRLGLRIRPLDPSSGKPLVDLRLYNEMPSEDDVRKWYSGNKDFEPGIGAVCGKASGNLVVFKFNDDEAFQLFRLEASTVTSVVDTWIFRHSSSKYIVFRVEDKPGLVLKEGGKPGWRVEVIGEGGLVPLPPSIISGERCEWVQLDGVERGPGNPELKAPATLSVDEYKQLLDIVVKIQAESLKTTTLREPREWIELSEKRVDSIVEILKLAGKPGFLKKIVQGFSTLSARHGVHPASVAEVVRRLHSEVKLEVKASLLHAGEEVEPLEDLLNVVLCVYKSLYGEIGVVDELRNIYFNWWDNGKLRSRVAEKCSQVEDNGENDSSEFHSILEEAVGGDEARRIEDTVRRELESAVENDKGEKRLLKLAKNPLKLIDQLELMLLRKYMIRAYVVGGRDKKNVLGVYCWDGAAWSECSIRLKNELRRIVDDIPLLREKVGSGIVGEVLRRIELDRVKPLEYEPLMIAFRNGLVLDWEMFTQTGDLERSLVKADPDLTVFHLIPHRIPVEKLKDLSQVKSIEEMAERLCPRTLKAFKEWVGDRWLLLFELIGYTLYPRYALNKAFMLIGEGSNGKSTYLTLLRDILGSENVVAVSLQELASSENRFAKAQLYHKLANIYPDLLREGLRDTGGFKALTGEDRITVDRKFRDPITFVNYAKLIFATNTLPKVDDRTRAFWRRWIVIEFPNQFPDNPKFYEETFTPEEKEGAIIVGLHAFLEVLKRGKFSYEESIESIMDLWLRESNTVYAFIKEMKESGRIVDDPNGRVEVGELYNRYVEWCNEEGESPVSKKVFTEEMERLGYRRDRTWKARYYKGLKLINDKEDWFRSQIDEE